jgi:hypothetical protein
VELVEVGKLMAGQVTLRGVYIHAKPIMVFTRRLPDFGTEYPVDERNVRHWVPMILGGNGALRQAI